MTDPITKFSGKYRFLSNFFPSTVVLSFFKNKKRHVFSMPTVENAYQAAKIDPRDLERVAKTQAFVTMTAAEAKKAGRRVVMRANWDDIKIEVMTVLLRQKFRHGDLRDLLLSTGDAELLEGNHWGDRFWGVDSVTGAGDNHLGQILMKVRSELREG